MAFRILIVVLVAVSLVGVLVYSQLNSEPLRVSGLIEADEIRLGSQVGGRVQSVDAQEGQPTKVGDVLVVLEPFDLLERKAEAQAFLEAARAEHARLASGYRSEEVGQAKARRDQLAAMLDKLRAGPRKQTIAAAEARLEAARLERNLTRLNFERTQRVFQRGATTQADIDRVTEERNAAEARVIVYEQDLDELKEGTRLEEIREAEARLAEADEFLTMLQRGYREEEIAVAKAKADATAAALASIERQIAELQIKAPVDGIIEAVELQPGDLVTPRAPVLSLMDTSKLWIRAYVPENRLNVKTGQRVAIAVDSFPDERFTGEITYISRQAEFTPSNVQTSEERSKQVFRIKVTLLDGLDKLRPGMAGDVYLETLGEKE